MKEQKQATIDAWLQYNLGSAWNLTRSELGSVVWEGPG
jgi:hypothetical protein